MWQPSIQKLTRDLFWVFDTPSLIDEGYSRSFLYPHWKERIAHKTFDESSAEYVKKHPFSKREYKRLGYYFEYLFKMGIHLLSPHKMVLENAQVKREGVTLGEIDYITQNGDGKYFHWEIAVKFYLQTGNSVDLSRWVGPNQKDTFQKKWRKLIGHQLPLVQKGEGKDLLTNRGIEKVQSTLFVKGMLFRSLHHEVTSYPDVVNLNHQKGWWVFLHDLTRFFDRTMEWVILPKHDWLAPFLTNNQELILNTASLQAHLKNGSPQFRPQMVVGVEPKDGYYQEITRGFIVPKDWGSD